ncbi:MAG: DUF1800 domain-containing protein [Hamadaea sp.]|nr:DUF1800 domain-containing protein [Hamadaea sp.]
MADRELVAHLLRRATFGPTRAEIDAAAGLDLTAVVASLVRPRGADATATPLPVFTADPYFGRTGQMTREERQRAQQASREQLTALTTAWLTRMVTARHQLTEKMVFFWHGHWATSAQKVRSATLMRAQLETFRLLGRGDFAVYARAMVRDPALIFWLDGQRNTRKAPNENLARELMELFTLGIGAYGEADVKAAAKALTGWTIDRGSGSARFVANRHAEGGKTVLGVTRDFDADSLVDLLVAHEAHPRFLAARLWHRFGSVEAVPDATRDRMVAAYGAGHDVDAMLTALFTDDRFATARGQLVKQPIEWAVGAIRQLGIPASALRGKLGQQILNGVRAMGQLPLRPPSVGGWPSGTAWLTTSSLQARMRLAAQIAAVAPQPAKDIDELARTLAVDGWTGRTRQALTQARGKPQRLLTLALISPDYAVS